VRRLVIAGLFLLMMMFLLFNDPQANAGPMTRAGPAALHRAPALASTPTLISPWAATASCSVPLAYSRDAAWALNLLAAGGGDE
jgi:hypothetical protein